jgi:peptidyl-prolyl cis-trans isomerase A (cyclophilin A)
MPRMTRTVALAIAVLVAPALAIAQGSEAPQKPASTKKAEPGGKKAEPAAAAKAPKELYATFVTSMGKIGVRLFPEQKPNAVKNFVELAEGKKEWTDPRTGQRSKKPLYDGTVFHRVIPSFMIQGGDPLGKGVGGPGYAIPDELEPGEHFFDQPCQLAYANSGPNTNGSQFFITEVPTLHLNPVKCDRSPSGLCGYVRFGEGVCGCDLVGKIARAGNSKTTLEKVVISKAKPTCQ